MQLSHLPQQPVAGDNADGVVDQLEVLDVGAEDVVARGGVAHEDVANPLVEVAFAVDVGDVVVARLLGQGDGLAQAHDGRHAAERQLGAARFGDEAVGAMGEGRHLLFLASFGRDRDDGQGGEARVGLEALGERLPIGRRARCVGKDEGEVAALVLQELQSLVAILRLQDRVARGQGREEACSAVLVGLDCQNLLVRLHTPTAVHVRAWFPWIVPCCTSNLWYHRN